MLFLSIIILITISIFLVWFLIVRDRGEKEPTGALWAAVGFGFLGLIVAGILESLLIPREYTDLSKLAQSEISPGLFLAFLTVGIIEEFVKFVPLAIYIYRKRYFNEHTDGIIYFALAGLGFGLPENILYTLTFGANTGFARILLTPFFHSAMTGLVGYYLIKAKVDKKPLWTVGVALLVAMFIHGLYDFGLVSRSIVLALISVMITISMTAGLFILYARAREIDQSQGLSAVGHNKFCRSCGFPNKKGYLYCSRCGKRT